MFSGLFKKTKKKISDSVSTLGAVANDYRKTLGDYANNTGRNVASYLTKPQGAPNWMKSADSNLRKFSQSAENIPKFNFASKIKNPVGKFAAEIPQSIMNIPSRTVSGAFKDYGKINAKPSYFVKRGSEAANIGVDIGSTFAGGGTIKKIATDGFKKATRTGVMDAIKTGVKRGAKEGLIYGGASGTFSGAQEGKNLKEQGSNAIKSGATGAILGAIGGAVLGGTFAGGGAVGRKTVNGVKNEAKKVSTDIMNFKNPYTKRIITKVDREPNYGVMIHGKPQMVPVAGTERKVIQTIKEPFKPQSILGKVLNTRPGLNIQDVNSLKPKVVSSKVMDFNNKIALKNKKAQEVIARQRQNQRLKLDKAEKGFIPPQRVKATQKAVLEVKQSKQEALPSMDELVNKKPVKESFPSIKALVENKKKEIKTETPDKIQMPDDIKMLQRMVDEGKLINPKNYKKLMNWRETPVKTNTLKAVLNDSPFSGDEFDFNKFQEKAYKEKGERIDAIREVIDYPKELRTIGYMKKEIDRIGVDQAKRIVKLGKLGYPKNEIQKMDFDRMDLILQKEVPYQSLKSYYKRKHELDTNYLDGINLNKLKDISAPMTGWRDVYRNFETVFGDEFPKIKEQLLDPFDASKGEFINEQKILLGELEENIVKKLGIKKGSDADKAVVLFGEGKLGEQELMQKFPKEWRNIIEADKWFKTKYPQLLKELNTVREYFFPTHPLYPESTKIIPERKDYYRHGKDLEGITGLKNLFEGPSSIDPSLAASSDVTNPKTKWASFTQKRKGEDNDFGAVEGYLDYLKSYAYAKHIDPFISKFKGVDEEAKGNLPIGSFIHENRGLAEELSQKMDPIQQITDSTDIAQIKKILTDHNVSEAQADWMGKDLANLNNYEKVKSYIQGKTAKNKENVLDKMGFKAMAEDSENKLNNFLVFIKNFSRDLGGKTNPIDRGLQENLFGRKALSIINWGNSRFKANAVLGNASSSAAQYFNIPQGYASAGTRNSAKAIGHSLAGIFTKDTPIKQSNFVNERYFNNYDKFDEGVLANTKKFAIWMTGIGDKIGTKFIWNAHYQKALSEGVSDPIKYADDWTRKLVGGRGIGEVPIAQKSKLVQLVAPFQLEVANQWYALKDIAKNDPNKLVIAKKMMEFAVASYLMNRVVKEIRGSDVSFDPINAMIEAYGEYQGEDSKIKGSMKAGGRMAGEVFSNMPGGQTIAGMYPEYGFGVNKENFPNIAEFMNIPRKELFGEGDPTRFGTGGLPLFSAIKNPLTGLVTPYGGKQLEKSYGGIKTLMQGFAENKTGKVMTPVNRDTTNIMRGVLFGKNATGEMQDYFDNKQTPLSDLQSEKFKLMGNDKSYFDDVILDRKAENEKESFKKNHDKITSGKLSDDVYQLSNGKFYSKSIGSEFETQEKAEREAIKEDFRKSDENFRDLGDRILRKTEDGTVSDISKTKFDTMLNSANLILLKKNENLDKWIETADKQFDALNKMLMDPSVDELEKVEIQSKIETLIDDYQKYSEYGGFTKPKKGKKLEEKYRYPLIDTEFMKIAGLINGINKKPRILRKPTQMTFRRLPRVRRRKRK